jgi:hypothetical protein
MTREIAQEHFGFTKWRNVFLAIGFGMRAPSKRTDLNFDHVQHREGRSSVVHALAEAGTAAPGGKL